MTTYSYLKLSEIFALYGNPFTRGNCLKNTKQKLLTKYYKKVDFDSKFEKQDKSSFNINRSLKNINSKYSNIIKINKNNNISILNHLNTYQLGGNNINDNSKFIINSCNINNPIFNNKYNLNNNNGKFLLLKHHTITFNNNNNKNINNMYNNVHFFDRNKTLNCISIKNSNKGNFTLNTGMNTNQNKLSNYLVGHMTPLRVMNKLETKFSLNDISNNLSNINEKEMYSSLFHRKVDSIAPSLGSNLIRSKILIKDESDMKFSNKDN